MGLNVCLMGVIEVWQHVGMAKDDENIDYNAFGASLLLHENKFLQSCSDFNRAMGRNL